MKKAVLFDLDGTLWDFGEGCAKAWNHILETKGYTPLSEEDMHSVMGMTMEVIGQKLFGDLDEQERKRLMKECELYENEYVIEHGGKLFDGVIELLNELHATYAIGIVSNCQCGYIEAFVKHYGLGQVVDFTRSYGDFQKEKAQNIADVVRENGIEQAVYVGDIYNDYLSAKQAGVPFILASYGFGPFEYPIHADSVPEIKMCVEQIFDQ